MLEVQLRAFLEERKVPFHIAKKSFITDCVNPACGKEGHLWIRKQTGRSICFKCNTRWSWRSLVAQIAKIPLSKVADVFFGGGGGDYLDEVLDPNLFDTKYFKELFGPTSDKPINLGPDFVHLERSNRGLEYVISRGILSGALIAQYDLRYIAAMNAVVFPVRFNQQIYGWQARKIAPAEDELRLISSKFNKSHFLLNYDRAQFQKNIILVEGPFDCLHVDLEGYGAVASLGKGVSQEQIQLLLNSPCCENIYLGLDPDASEEVYELINFMGFKKKVYRILPPYPRKDFGECSDVEVRSALDKAVLFTSQTDILDVYLKTRGLHGSSGEEETGKALSR